jgi:Tol biopolymer transport system component
MRDSQDQRMKELAYRLTQMAPEAPPFPKDDLVRLKNDPAPAIPTSRRTPVFVATLAGALVIAIAVPVLLLSGDSAPPPATQPTTPAPPAANGWIAFTVYEQRDHDIWLVSLDAEPRRVIGTETDRVHQLCPAFSPDGRSLAYGRVEGDFGTGLAALRSAALVIADVSGDGRVSDRFSVDLGDGLPPPCPVWSPDGDRVAFGVPRTSPINAERAAVGSEVWIVRLADRDVTILPDLLATDLEWSPDGSVLAIASGSDHVRGERDYLADGRIHLYELENGSVRVLEATVGTTFFAWSPDGRRLAYTAGTETDGVDELRLIDLETGHQRVLDPGYRANHGIGPVWSPDGDTIVYQRLECENHHSDDCSGERHEVVLVTPADAADAADAVTTKVVIAPFPVTPPTPAWGGNVYPFWVTWSPDGDYLLYRAFDTLLVAVPVDLVTPPVILYRGELSAYDGYPDTSFVPIQTWGNPPSG